jgi:crotonobetaine/carnitine-CoA ligase
MIGVHRFHYTDNNRISLDVSAQPLLLETVVPYLQRNAKEAPDKVVHICDGEPVTNAELYHRAIARANAYLALGLRHGDPVACFMPNSLEHAYSWAACSFLGAVHVPVNALLRGESLHHVLGTTECSVVVVAPEFLSRVTDIYRELPHLRAIVVAGSHDDAAAASELAGVVVTSTQELAATTANSESIESDYVPTWRDTNVVIFTGGTTGPSKGVAMSQSYLIEEMKSTQRACDFKTDSTYYSPFPLNHINAFGLSLVMPIVFQGSGVTASSFSASAFWDDCRKYGVTHISLFGALYLMIYNQPPRPDDPDNSVIYSMGYCPEEIWDKFEERFGITITTAYALSECTMVSYFPAGEKVVRGTDGRPNPEIEVRILDDNGLEVPVGQPGEICLRPRRPGVMFDGYYKNPQATVEAFRDYWFHTGDIGRISVDGLLTFVDRKADYIRRRGENVSTYEVEQVILKFGAVAEVAVHAVPSELAEDEIKACIVLRPGQTVDYIQLLDFCSSHMPYYAVPRYVEIVEQLPRSPIGRVQKFELRKLGITPNTWDAQAVGYVVRR